jgi:Auxiliary Activity family 9 (formerly GH61)
MKHVLPFYFFALAAAFAQSVLAHGHLRSIAIDGTLFKGNVPNVSNFSSPIRLIDDITPVKGATNRAVNCGKNAQIAAQVVPANAGSTVAFDWASGTGGNVSRI